MLIIYIYLYGINHNYIVTWLISLDDATLGSWSQKIDELGSWSLLESDRRRVAPVNDVSLECELM